jgi:hypothetical protein
VLLFHRPPGAVVVAERLVDQVQIDLVQSQAFEGALEGSAGVGLARVLDP